MSLIFCVDIFGIQRMSGRGEGHILNLLSSMIEQYPPPSHGKKDYHKKTGKITFGQQCVGKSAKVNFFWLMRWMASKRPAFNKKKRRLLSEYLHWMPGGGTGEGKGGGGIQTKSDNFRFSPKEIFNDRGKKALWSSW